LSQSADFDRKKSRVAIPENLSSIGCHNLVDPDLNQPPSEPESGAENNGRERPSGAVNWTGTAAAIVHIGKDSRSEDRLMAVRGIRGATSVEADTTADVLSATTELLQEILRANQIETFDEIVSAIFTTTCDLTSTFPAEAARALGMHQVPLLCACEIPVRNSMPRCIRVLLHVNSEKTQQQMVHVYLRDAKRLRPDVKSAQ
jgi:chorismate mutase